MSIGLIALDARSEFVQLLGAVVFAMTALPFFALGWREARRR